MRPPTGGKIAADLGLRAQESGPEGRLVVSTAIPTGGNEGMGREKGEEETLTS